MIYVASPYSHPDANERKMRLALTAKYVNDLYQKGFVCVSPVLHCEQIERICKTPGSFDYWKTFCFDLLANSTEMHVLMLDGWENSTGVKAEIFFAEKEGIPIRYVELG